MYYTITQSLGNIKQIKANPLYLDYSELDDSTYGEFLKLLQKLLAGSNLVELEIPILREEITVQDFKRYNLVDLYAEYQQKNTLVLGVNNVYVEDLQQRNTLQFFRHCKFATEKYCNEMKHMDWRGCRKGRLVTLRPSRTQLSGVIRMEFNF